MPKFRLPLFSPDAGGEGAPAPAPAAETVAAPAVEAPTVPTPAPTPTLRHQPPKPLISYNPLLQSAPDVTAPEVVQPIVTPPPVIEELDFAGRKVPVVDPVIRDIHKDYSTLQKTYQETNQSMKSLQEQNTVYQNMIQMFQQQAQQAPPAPAPAPVVPQAPTPEDNEAFMSKWYEDPIATMKAIFESQVDAKLDAKLQPIQQERQAEQHQRQANMEVQTLAQKYEDFKDHTQAIHDLLEKNPRLGDQGLEMVYFVAKGQQAQAQQPPAPAPTPEQLLSDPTFRSQLIGNEAFRNEIISSYVQQRTDANQQVPPVMGTQPGGNAPMMPENRPKSIREASKMFAKSLGF